jgi:hypothetical protein
VLVREQPATELVIATRILARAGVLTHDRRITLRLKDVMYIGGRGVTLSTMTPYDVAVVLVADGTTLHGQPPSDVESYLEMHRRSPEIVSLARVTQDDCVTAPSLRRCVIAALRRARGEEPLAADDAATQEAWVELVAEARVSGALLGAFPTENEAP